MRRYLPAQPTQCLRRAPSPPSDAAEGHTRMKTGMDAEVTLLDRSHRAAFADFSRVVWGVDVDAPEWTGLPGDARNPYEAASPSCSSILISDGRIIGHITSTPVKLWCDGHETFMHWLSGFHMLPETRGKGLAKLLIGRLMEERPVLSAVVVVEASRRSFLSNGWEFSWKIPEYVQLLDARAFISTFSGVGLRSVPPALQWVSRSLKSPVVRDALGVVGTFANAAYQSAWSVATRRADVEVRPTDHFDEEIDALWQRNRSRVRCAQARESAYLNFMFPAAGGWLKLRFLERGQLVGYAVLATARLDEWQGLHGITLATVVDMFWELDRDDVAQAILASAADIARARGAQVLLCSGTDRRMQKAATRSGLLPIPKTVWYGYHSGDTGVHLPVRPSDWFANRGDADAVGSLGPRP